MQNRPSVGNIALNRRSVSHDSRDQMSRIGLAVRRCRLVSRRTTFQFHFCSAFASKVVVYGHRLCDLPPPPPSTPQINETLKWLSLLSILTQNNFGGDCVVLSLVSIFPHLGFWSRQYLSQDHASTSSKTPPVPLRRPSQYLFEDPGSASSKTPPVPLRRQLGV